MKRYLDELRTKASNVSKYNRAMQHLYEMNVDAILQSLSERDVMHTQISMISSSTARAAAQHHYTLGYQQAIRDLFSLLDDSKDITQPPAIGFNYEDVLKGN